MQSNVANMLMKAGKRAPTRFFGAAAAAVPLDAGLPSYALSAPAITTTGTSIVTESLYGSGDVVSIAVKVKAGSRLETSNVNGLASFTAATSMEGANTSFGHFNADVDREFTTFSATVFKKDVPKAFESLGDILTKPISSVEREARAGFVDCMTMDYRSGIIDQLHEAAYLDTPLGMAPIGSADAVAGLSAPDLDGFKKTFYAPDNMVVSVSGAGVDHAAVEGLVAKAFDKPTTTGSSSLAKTASGAVFTGSDKRIRFDSHPDALVAIGFEAASATSEDAVPLEVMKAVLGDWKATGPIGINSSTKLGREFAEGKFVKSYNAFNFAYADTGLFGVLFHATDNNLEDSMWYLMDNLVRLCHDVTDEEVERAKQIIKTSYLVTKGDGAANAAHNAAQLATSGRVQTTAEVFTRLDALTTSDVKAVANKYINDEDHALAAVGPIFELPDYNWIRRRSYWHRF